MRKERIGVNPAVPCPYRTWARVVFPVWSLSRALLTKAYVEAIWGPLALLMPVSQRGMLIHHHPDLLVIHLYG